LFDPTSRYYDLKTYTWTAPGGRVIAYVERRFVPPGDAMPLLVEVTVAQGDRLDLITARTLGDPTQFWRVCDANNALDPFELTAGIGRVIRVPVPQP
jgi:hypothetical protein